MNSARVTEALGTEKVTPLLLRLALPSMVGLLVGNLYVAVDRVFVGRIIGSQGLAAMNAVMPISILIFAFTVLIGRGCAIPYSIALGRRDYAEASRLFGTANALFFLVSMVFTVGSWCFLDEVLHAFGLPPEALPLGRTYLGIMLCGTFFAMFGMHNNLIRAEGYSTVAMCTQILGAVINVVLDWLFMCVFRWGIAGAAWATVIAQVVSALWVMSFFLRGRSLIRFRWRDCRIHSWRLVRSMTLYGSSPFVFQSFNCMIWTGQNHMLRDYGGLAAMAAFGAIMTVNQLLLTPLFGITMGMQPLVGYNLGARKYDRVIQILQRSFLVTGGFIVLPYLAVELLPQWVITVFTSDAEVLEIGAYSMRRYFSMLPLTCGIVLVSHYFQGVGRSWLALILILVRMLLFQMPFIFLLPLVWGYNGVVWSAPLADVLGFVMSMIAIRWEFRRLRTLTMVQGAAK